MPPNVIGSPTDKDLRAFGWAPGQYSAICTGCGRQIARTGYSAAKGVRTCRKCATKAWLTHKQAEAAKANHEEQRRRAQDRVTRARAANERLLADAEARLALERKLGVSREPKRFPLKARPSWRDRTP